MARNFLQLATKQLADADPGDINFTIGVAGIRAKFDHIRQLVAGTIDHIDLPIANANQFCPRFFAIWIVRIERFRIRGTVFILQIEGKVTIAGPWYPNRV